MGMQETAPAELCAYHGVCSGIGGVVSNDCCTDAESTTIYHRSFGSLRRCVADEARSAFERMFEWYRCVRFGCTACRMSGTESGIVGITRLASSIPIFADPSAGNFWTGHTHRASVISIFAATLSDVILHGWTTSERSCCVCVPFSTKWHVGHTEPKFKLRKKWC